MPNIVEVIQSAIDESGTVSIVYNGGSNPGQSRILIPVSLSTDELIAREPTARVAKHFKLAKIASASLSTGEQVINMEAVPASLRLAPNLDSFTEYAIFFTDSLKDSGFNVVERENYFAIVGFFKNGKPRKMPAASIQFVDRTTETVLNFESGELEVLQREVTGRERPWRVDSSRLNEGKAFGLLNKAAEFFLQEIHAVKGNANTA